MNARPLVRAVAFTVSMVVAAETAARQQVAEPPLTRLLRVYFDCRGSGCDQEFFRQELHWIDHVRDQNDADLHVMVTTQLTGGGGYEYTIRVIGRGRWEGREDVFRITSEAGESQDTLRRALLQTFSIALARYALETPIGNKLKLEPPPKSDAAQTSAQQDPWNYWVYRVNLNSFLNGQQRDRSSSYFVSASANRTTDAWKINISTGFSYSSNRFELSDGTFRSYVRGRNIGALVVKSLTDHWSAGAMVRASRQTFTNHRLNVRIAPGIEYNIFPYKESTNRQLTFQWTTGYNQFRYDEETIYGLTNESRWDEQFQAILSLRQPFGTVRLTSETAHYFDDPSKYRFAFFADNEVRLFRGFSLNVDGNYQIIHDQLYLPREGASDEEIIARQRQLATSYRYFLFLGVTYRFGSINNNIVNQRFGGGF